MFHWDVFQPSWTSGAHCGGPASTLPAAIAAAKRDLAALDGRYAATVYGPDGHGQLVSLWDSEYSDPSLNRKGAQ